MNTYPMQNAEHTSAGLEGLLSSEPWRMRLSMIADMTGFLLSVYASDGSLLFSSSASHPLCDTLRAASPELDSRCASFCHGLVRQALEKGAVHVFLCHANVVSFAVPLRHQGENAVILGRGWFSDYRDFRDYTDKLRHAGKDEFPVTGPLRFSSREQALRTGTLVDSTVNELLRSAVENNSLRHKIEGLKTVLGGWGAIRHDDPRDLYENLLNSLFMFLDLPHIALLMPDAERGAFTVRSTLRRQGATGASFTIGRDGNIAQTLEGGAPFFVVSDPDVRFGPAFLPPATFFPVTVGRVIEAVVAIFGISLREGDSRVISAFCRQTALTVENRRLQQDLYRKFDRFAAIADLTQAITPIQNYEALLRTILEKSADLLKAEQGSLMLLDSETDALLLEATKGIMEGDTEAVRLARGEGIAGLVAALGEPMLVENVEDDPRVRKKNRQRYKTPSFLSVPLKLEDRIIGVLNLSDKATGEVFTEEDLRIIQCFATHAAVVLDRNLLYTQTEKLKKLSITDHLTGLLNRRYLLDRLEEELSRSRRHSRHMGVLMLDLDGFKDYNDTSGHMAGDRALKIISDIILNAVRSMDVVARYGGDEFMIILPETDTALAANIGERLRADVERAVLPGRDGEARMGRAVTASIGIACYPEHGNTVDLLIDRVDRALYRAKERGRNRVEVYS